MMRVLLRLEFPSRNEVVGPHVLAFRASLQVRKARSARALFCHASTPAMLTTAWVCRSCLSRIARPLVRQQLRHQSSGMFPPCAFLNCCSDSCCSCFRVYTACLTLSGTQHRRRAQSPHRKTRRWLRHEVGEEAGRVWPHRECSAEVGQGQ